LVPPISNPKRYVFFTLERVMGILKECQYDIDGEIICLFLKKFTQLT